MILSTDSTANLPVEYYRKYNISMIPMQIILDGNTYDDLSPNLPVEEFYKKMSDGSTPTTAQINEYSAREYFEKLLSKGEDILHISFSSALSGTTATMQSLSAELNATHKNKIYVVNSLNAASGEGLLVMHAYDMIKKGMKPEAIVKELEKLIPLAKSFFTVQDLKYLVRGGRLSKVSGFIGTMLNIKPVLKVDPLGRLVPHKKVISRKLAIKALFNIIKDNLGDSHHVFIDHAVCKEDATRLAEMIANELNVNPVVTDLTQVIGCHTGPGLLAVFFISKKPTIE